MEYYCLTIRKCSNTKSVKTLERSMNVYEAFIQYIKGLSTDIHIEYHYEYTVVKEGQYNVHLHAMIKKPKGTKPIYFKGKKGYSLRYERCNSKKAWDAYISKNPYTKDEVLRLIGLYITHTYNNVEPSAERSSAFRQESPSSSDDSIDWTKRQLPKEDELIDLTDQLNADKIIDI